MKNIDWEIIKKVLSEKVSKEDPYYRAIQSLKSGLINISKILNDRDNLKRISTELKKEIYQVDSQAVKELELRLNDAEFKSSIIWELRSAWHAFWMNVYDEIITDLQRKITSSRIFISCNKCVYLLVYKADLIWFNLKFLLKWHLKAIFLIIALVITCYTMFYYGVFGLVFVILTDMLNLIKSAFWVLLIIFLIWGLFSKS